MAYCGQCGAKITGRFCGSCGAPAAEAREDAQNATAGPRGSSSSPYLTDTPPTRTDVRPQTTATSNPQWTTHHIAPPPPNAARSSAHWLIPTVVGVVLVAAFSVIAVVQGWLPLGQPSPPASAVPVAPTSNQPEPYLPAQGPPAPRALPSATNASTAPPVVVTPDSGQQLSEQRYADSAAFSLNGRWIAQLSSKYSGITDTTQVAANGTNTFNLDDILVEHQTLRSRFTSAGANVYLLQATDFGKQRNWPATIWVTVADPGLGSQDEVQQWCQAQFPHLSVKQVENVCMPRQLNPPSR